MTIMKWGLKKVTITGVLVCLAITLFTNRGLLTKLTGQTGLADRSNSSSTKYILTYTTYLRKPWMISSPKCSKDCVFTNNRKLLKSLEDYDALLFNERGLCFTWQLPDQSKRRPEQVYVFNSREPPMMSYTKYSLPIYQSFFNWTMTFRTDSDVPIPFGRSYPKKLITEESMRKVQDENEAFLKSKSKLAMIAANNCNHNERWEYIKELKKHLKISFHGNCFQEKRTESKDFYHELKVHKFFLAFENSMCKDYISEKFWRSLEQGIVPVVMGGIGREYLEFAPPNSYIDTKNFLSEKELADYLRMLDKNDKEYLKYFEWRKSHNSRQLGVHDSYCYLCEKLHDPELEPKVYENLDDWENKDKCDHWNSKLPFNCPYSDGLTEEQFKEQEKKKKNRNN